MATREQHGLRKTRAYNSWVSMKARCYNKSNNRYKNYGGRGIVVCEEWRRSFVRFFNDMGHPEKGQSIDRIDNNKDYNLENCKWSSAKEQSNNTRRCCLYTYKNETLNIKQFSEKYNINYGALHARLYKLKWPIEDAIEFKVKKGNNSYNLR